MCTSSQVERCLSFAEDGIEYDPRLFDIDDESDESFGLLLADGFKAHSDDHLSRRSEQNVSFLVLLLVFFALIYRYSLSKWYPIQKFHFK